MTVEQQRVTGYRRVVRRWGRVMHRRCTSSYAAAERAAPPLTLVHALGEEHGDEELALLVLEVVVHHQLAVDPQVGAGIRVEEQPAGSRGAGVKVRGVGGECLMAPSASWLLAACAACSAM